MALDQLIRQIGNDNGDEDNQKVHGCHPETFRSSGKLHRKDNKEGDDTEGEVIQGENSFADPGCLSPLNEVESKGESQIKDKPQAKAYMAIYGAPGFDQTNQLTAKFVTNLKSVPEMIFISSDKNSSRSKPHGRLPVPIFSKDDKELLFDSSSGITFSNDTGKE